MMYEIFFLTGAYLAGSVPFAYILVKIIKGIDIRTVGSGNAGATNAARVLGKWGFITVFILDMLKGFLPVFAAYCFFGKDTIVLLVMLAAVFGHTFTVFLSFKGGKGVATAAGAFVALVPFETLIAVIAFLIVFAITRMVSVGSITAAVALFISVMFLEQWLLLKVFTGLIAAFVIYKHKANISRILKGTENRFERKNKRS